MDGDPNETETKTKRRHEILDEILKSERSYVDFLDKLIQVSFLPVTAVFTECNLF
jgi:hypothetical protein